MKFSILLFALYAILKFASIINKAFRKHIGFMRAKILIKTADGKRARLFIFDKGKLSSVSGDRNDFDVQICKTSVDNVKDVMNHSAGRRSYYADFFRQKG